MESSLPLVCPCWLCHAWALIGSMTWLDRQVMDRGYEVLLVSQFTLFGILKGNKPDFHYAMPPVQVGTPVNEAYVVSWRRPLQ